MMYVMQGGQNVVSKMKTLQQTQKAAYTVQEGVINGGKAA